MHTAVTFDFHETIARCPAWFELEVRRLPAAFLLWRAERTGRPVAPDRLAEAETAYRRLRQEIIEHGRELPAEACVERILTEIGEPVDPVVIATGVASLMRATLAEATPVPGAVATVRAVAAAGVPVGVVSSAVYHPFLDWTLAAFGLGAVCREVVTSASTGFYKSRPEIYWHAAARLGADPERTVHVGDSYRFDVVGARRAGMRTVWLRRDPTTAPGDGDPPDITLTSMEEGAPLILDLLRQLPAPSAPSERG